jgi:predicted ATPase/DNA-binding SARP family transcriptional activator
VTKLCIFLFGYPRVECDGAVVPIRRRKALALLSYLAATGSSHSRDVLAALLWPEHEAARAYAFLRNALWILNATPLSRWLVSTRHTIGLRDDPELSIDVASFRIAHSRCLEHDDPRCMEHLSRAVDSFRADFLEGFSVDDSESFEDWQYSESAALRQELAVSLEQLARVHEGRSQLDDAVRFARRWLDVQPLNEVAHRRVIELHARSGQRAAALSQFETCRKTLKAELGLAPSEETSALAELIRRGESGSPAPPRIAEAIPVKLPQYRTPLVGREQEISKAVDLLRAGECRLLTITGPGGSGKTRLAVAAASQSVGLFPDGVVFVPLVSTLSSSHVPLEIADVLGAYCAPDTVDEAQGASTPGAFSDLLLARLKPRRLLLVLDNMEHLLTDLRWVDTLLANAPGVALLVTSRHQLNLQDEWVLGIEGLPFPDEAVPLDDLADFDAVSLFLQSARRANTSFSPTEEDWEAISQIVQLLQGMPLGIELAAAWARTMSCRTIAYEISDSLDFLSARLRDIPKRHHSLRAVFEQSWSLLSKDARTAFRRLSVFRGSFSLDAAKTVADTTLPILSSLVARSLLRRTAPERFEMLEVLRQYAEERLRVLPEEDARVRGAHSATYLSLLAEQEGALKGRDQRTASELVLADIDNVRSGWRWAIAAGRLGLLERAALGLFLYCDMRNSFDEGTELFREAAEGVSGAHESDGGESSVLYGFLRGLEGWFARMRRGASVAKPLFAEGLRALEGSGMGRELALINLLWAFAGYGSIEDRRKRLTESLSFFEEAQFPWEAAEALEALAATLIETDSDAALAHAQRSVRIHERLADPWGIAMAKCTLGNLYTTAGDHERARAQLEESLALRQENDLDPLGAMQCIIELGYLAAEAEDWAEAARCYADALAIAEEKGARWAQASILEWLASVSAKSGDRACAARHARAALTIYESFSRRAEIERCESLLESFDDTLEAT